MQGRLGTSDELKSLYNKLEMQALQMYPTHKAQIFNVREESQSQKKWQEAMDVFMSFSDFPKAAELFLPIVSSKVSTK